MPSVELTTEQILCTLNDLYPTTKTILLIEQSEDTRLRQLPLDRVACCLVKDELSEALAHVIRAVAAGEALFSHSVVEKMLRCTDDFDYAAYDLTEREWEVLTLMARGLTNAKIAATLHLSERTVRNKATLIYGKIGVDSRTAFLAWAHQQGISST